MGEGQRRLALTFLLGAAGAAYPHRAPDSHLRQQIMHGNGTGTGYDGGGPLHAKQQTDMAMRVAVVPAQQNGPATLSTGTVIVVCCLVLVALVLAIVACLWWWWPSKPAEAWPPPQQQPPPFKDPTSHALPATVETLPPGPAPARQPHSPAVGGRSGHLLAYPAESTTSPSPAGARMPPSHLSGHPRRPMANPSGISAPAAAVAPPPPGAMPPRTPTGYGVAPTPMQASARPVD